MAAFSTSEKTSTSYPPHQVGRQPLEHGSKRGKRQVVFSDLCAYHAKFEDKAYKCAPPCPWNDRVAAIDFEVAGNEEANHLE